MIAKMQKREALFVYLITITILSLLLAGCDGVIQKKDVEDALQKSIVCKKPYMRFELGCCLDENDNAICDQDEDEKVKSINTTLEGDGSGKVVIKNPSPDDLPSYDTTDTQVQFLIWESLEHEIHPEFSWKPPMYRPSIKGYWLRIDDGEWKLVESLVFKWKSDNELSNGVHEFFIRPEYSDGKYGLINSLYFTINTGLPDFIVQDVAWEVLNTQGEGESKIYLISITPTVSNQGTKDFMWGLPKVPQASVRIYKDDSTSPEGAKGVESLDVGESKVHEYVTASGYPKEFVFGAGEHTIRVTINEDYPSYETVEEADFSNNGKIITIHLGE